MPETMTKEQIENFKRVLLLQIGPYALLLSDEEVTAYRDKLQKKLDGMA